MIDSIIFDLDGTLWDASESICKSWNLSLRKYEDITKTLTLEDMKSIMGLTIENLAIKLFPEVSFDRALEIAKNCCYEECSFICKHGAKIFEGLEKVLIELVKDYKLFIVSNCQEGYIESFYEYSNLSAYFTDHECSGNTGLDKGDNIKMLVKRNGLSNPIYIGDTMGDYNACQKANVPFVFAKYGFGKVTEETYSICDIRELFEVLKKLT